MIEVLVNDKIVALQLKTRHHGVMVDRSEKLRRLFERLRMPESKRFSGGLSLQVLRQ